MNERGNSGIYEIRNTVNGKRYIGQAASIGDRWYTHKSHLNLGRHHCRHLQSAWKKYGSDSFVFSVLERIPADRDLLAAREQHWFDLLRPEYNIAPVAGSNLGLKRGPHRPETIEKIRLASTGRRHKPETIDLLKRIQSENTYRPSKAHIEKMRRYMTGRKLSPESIAKTRAANLGRKQSPEEIARRSAALKGHTVSAETRAKIGAANRVSLRGKKQSPETIAKRVAAIRGRPRPDVGDRLRGVKRPANVVAAIRKSNDARYADRRGRIRAAILADPSASAASIARLLGVDRGTVCKYKKELAT